MSVPRIALRLDETGHLDDVVVEPVTMFRAEFMSKNDLWLCCYTAGAPDFERIAWNVRGKNLRMTTIETPREFEDWDASRDLQRREPKTP